MKRTIDRKLLVAAFDGPLCSDLKLTGHYRLAEQLLTRRLQERIGKPGQASSPTGKLLNHHANLCARVVLRTGMLNDASHDHAIHRAALVEAFPSSFLGVLLDEPETISVDRSNRSDKYYASLAQSDGLNALLKHLLPGRMLIKSFGDIKNHDERAAIVCALTALCVAAGDHTVVGDAKDGWIVLPPATFIQPWAKAILSENAEGGGLECRAP